MSFKNLWLRILLQSRQNLPKIKGIRLNSINRSRRRVTESKSLRMKKSIKKISKNMRKKLHHRRPTSPKSYPRNRQMFQNRLKSNARVTAWQRSPISTARSTQEIAFVRNQPQETVTPEPRQSKRKMTHQTNTQI